MLVVATVGWLIAWFAAAPLAEWLTFSVLGLERGTPLGEAVAFFLYDVPKVLLLLAVIVWVVAIVRSFFGPGEGADGAGRPQRRRGHGAAAPSGS